MHPVLLLHGALGSQTQFTALKAALERTGTSVYTMNFSGHGGAPFRKSFGIETFAHDVADFLKSNHLLQVNIFGYSMGGYVALWLAHEQPQSVAKIVTLGTKFDWSPASAQVEVKKLIPEKIIEKVPAFARLLEHRHAPNDWKQLLEQTSSLMLRLGHRPLLTDAIFKTIQHQVLVCLGDQDDMADARYSEHVGSILPNGRFRLLANTHHPIERVDVATLVGLVV
jgi:pimeloyl-ACP methyl ester carboxylesterase